jgi:hypothetical protein
MMGSSNAEAFGGQSDEERITIALLVILHYFEKSTQIVLFCLAE